MKASPLAQIVTSSVMILFAAQVSVAEPPATPSASSIDFGPDVTAATAAKEAVCGFLWATEIVERPKLQKLKKIIRASPKLRLDTNEDNV